MPETGKDLSTGTSDGFGASKYAPIMRGDRVSVREPSDLPKLPARVRVAYVEDGLSFSAKFVRNDNPNKMLGGFMHEDVRPGEGTIVDKDAIVMKSKIGKNVGIGPGATIGYGAVMEDGAQLLGNNNIGDFATVGAGAILEPGADVKEHGVVDPGKRIPACETVYAYGLTASVSPWML
jgi:acetyltransferase-like isoleucine patch superfamily enzyme